MSEIKILNKLKEVLNKKSLTTKNDKNWEIYSSYLNSRRSRGLDVDDVESSEDYCETVYFIALKHLSETMSKMRWVKRKISKEKGREPVYDSDLDYILNVKPNDYTTASQFWASIELNKIHYGNAYAYIETDKNGKVKKLWQLETKNMEVWVDDAGVFGNKNAIWYRYQEPTSSVRYTFEFGEILHFKNSFSFNGLMGMSIKDILRTQIATNKHATGFLHKFYKAGMFGSKVAIYHTGELSIESEKRVAAELENATKQSTSGKFIPMPLGWQAQMLDMKLADAQFFENNKISSLQLAAAFGIKPNIINDYSKSSYSNSESQQIDFFVNTLQPLFTSYEQELTSKLLPESAARNGLRLAINEKSLFKLDSKTQAEVYTTYLSNFVMTPNEVREELDLPDVSEELGFTFHYD